MKCAPALLAVFFACAACIPAASAGGFYQWKDKDGKVHFGDTPPATRQGAPAPASTLRSMPEATLNSATAAGSSQMERNPVDRSRIDRGIQQYQAVKQVP